MKFQLSISNSKRWCCESAALNVSTNMENSTVATGLEMVSFHSNPNECEVKVKVKLLSRVRLFATPWTVAYQAPPSMGFSRQECWSGLPFPSPGDLPDPGIKPGSPALQADALPSEPPGKVPKKGNAKECSNYHTIVLLSYTSKVMLKILHARLQPYVNCELPDVQSGFRKGRGTRDQIANIRWIIEKARSSRKTLLLLY